MVARLILRVGKTLVLSRLPPLIVHGRRFPRGDLLHVYLVAVLHPARDEVEEERPRLADIRRVLLAQDGLPRQVQTLGEDVEVERVVAADRSVVSPEQHQTLADLAVVVEVVKILAHESHHVHEEARVVSERLVRQQQVVIDDSSTETRIKNSLSERSQT